MLIPKLEEALQYGSKTSETAPILIDRKTEPDAVPLDLLSDAASAKHRAEGAAMFADALQGLSGQVARVGLAKQAAENRNDTVNGNITYRQDVAKLERDLLTTKGVGARDIAKEFAAGQLLIRARILGPLNSVVGKALGPLMDAQMFSSTQRILDHQKSEIDDETLAATQMQVEQRIMDVLASDDIAAAAETAVTYVQQLEDEAIPGESQTDRDKRKRGWVSKIHSAVVEHLTSNPLDIDATRKGIDYYQKHQGNLTLDDHQRFTKQIAKAGNDIAVIDTYTEIEALGFSNNYTKTVEFLEDNNIPEETQRAVKARVRENINEISIQKAEKGVELNDKFMEQWKSLPTNDYEGRMHLLEDFTDSLSPEDQLLFDPHRSKFLRRLRADYPRLHKDIMSRFQRMVATNPKGFMGDLVQKKLDEYVADEILTPGDRAALHRKYKEIYGGIDPVSGKQTGKRMPEALPATILKWAKEEFNLDDDQAFALEDDFAKWMIASAHAMDPKSYYQDLQDAVRLLVGEDSIKLLDKTPDLLDDIMYSDYVLEGMDMPQQVFRQIYTRVIGIAKAQGHNMTQEEAGIIATQVMRESEDIPYMARAYIRGVHNGNVYDTQRAKDEVRYKKEMGLEPEERDDIKLPTGAYPSVRSEFAGEGVGIVGKLQASAPHLTPDDVKSQDELEEERQADIQEVMGKYGAEAGKPFEPPQRVSSPRIHQKTQSVRRQLYDDLLEAGSTQEELEWLRPKLESSDPRADARRTLGQAWAYVKGGFSILGVAFSGFAGPKRTSGDEVPGDFDRTPAELERQEFQVRVLNEMWGVIGDALKTLDDPKPHEALSGPDLGYGAGSYYPSDRDTGSFEVPADAVDTVEPTGSLTGIGKDYVKGSQDKEHGSAQVYSADSPELSAKFKNVNGGEPIPLLVPTLTKKQIDHLLSGKKPTKVIELKAITYAQKRIKAGKPVGPSLYRNGR